MKAFDCHVDFFHRSTWNFSWLAVVRYLKSESASREAAHLCNEQEGKLDFPLTACPLAAKVQQLNSITYWWIQLLFHYSNQCTIWSITILLASIFGDPLGLLFACLLEEIHLVSNKSRQNLMPSREMESVSKSFVGWVGGGGGSTTASFLLIYLNWSFVRKTFLQIVCFWKESVLSSRLSYYEFQEIINLEFYSFLCYYIICSFVSFVNIILWEVYLNEIY